MLKALTGKNAVIGFAGGGGVECGFLSLGIRPALAIEFDPQKPELSSAIADCHEENFGKYGELLRMSVEEWAAKDFPNCPETIDYAHFSPVCSNFSQLNNNQESLADIESAIAIAKFIKKKKPTNFTLENVPSYSQSASAPIVRIVLNQCGYQVKEAVLDLSRLGVPQSRKRYFAIASLKEARLPIYTERSLSWFEALKGDIRSLNPSTLLQAQKTTIQSYKLDSGSHWIIPRVGYRTLPRAIAGDKPAPTITRAIFTDQRGNSRTRFWDIWSQARAYQVDFNCMRKLSTFPDWYNFPSKLAIAGSILGYAVPPEAIKNIYSQSFDS